METTADPYRMTAIVLLVAFALMFLAIAFRDSPRVLRRSSPQVTSSCGISARKGSLTPTPVEIEEQQRDNAWDSVLIPTPQDEKREDGTATVNTSNLKDITKYNSSNMNAAYTETKFHKTLGSVTSTPLAILSAIGQCDGMPRLNQRANVTVGDDLWFLNTEVRFDARQKQLR